MKTHPFAACAWMVGFIRVLAGQPAVAQVQPYPASFHVQRIATNGTTLHVRVGGTGPAVVLLHGYGETGDMWAPLAARLAAQVTHDIGNMVGYAFAEHPGRVRRFVLIDAPLPGVGPWDDIVRSHAHWHFSFWGPDAERLVAGRERIYFDRFWNEFSADPRSFSEESRAHYAALYAQPGAMHAGFEQFKAFDQDAIDNKAFVAKAKLALVTDFLSK